MLEIMIASTYCTQESIVFCLDMFLFRFFVLRVEIFISGTSEVPYTKVWFVVPLFPERIWCVRRGISRLLMGILGDFVIARTKYRSAAPAAG